MESLRDGSRADRDRRALSGGELFVFSLPILQDPGLPIAAARAGATGILDLSLASDPLLAQQQAAKLARLARGACGLLIAGDLGPVDRAALAAVGACDLVLLADDPDRSEADWGKAVSAARAVARRVGAVCLSGTAALRAERAGCDLLIAKGHEAGGCVGEETTFVLLQRLLRQTKLPLIALGGIGPRTAAACLVAGAAGVGLDWQLALARESALDDEWRAKLARIDGSETVAINGPGGRIVRCFSQPAFTAPDKLSHLADTLADGDPQAGRRWNDELRALLQAPAPQDRLWPVGQDAAFAAAWGERGHTVARALRWLRAEAQSLVAGCRQAAAWQAGSPLARSHRTEYPVVQGPMTRVSDVPEFALAVAEGGGLPFLALAMMRGADAHRLLAQTKALLGDRSWGVGVLGFAERELRTEQFAAIEEICPPFAVIAGGRPDQAASLEARGITTYLHVPSPGMLAMFLREGARRFVFEGRECGGHVGPRTSFVLWESMLNVLLAENLSPEQAAQVHVLFAGGIHDDLSASMVAAIAQPLVERGMKVGVLLGTAYLFTHEIVGSGAIVPGFQKQAIAMDETVLLETGPGHATRCARTPFFDAFCSERRRLALAGTPAEQIREELEHLNLGRLRIASKGLTRAAAAAGGSSLVSLDERQQEAEGMYMIGQVAALRGEPCSIRELHANVCSGAVERLATKVEPLVELLPEEPAPPPLEVAIVGVACLLPGAHDGARYWRNILDKRDLVSEIPGDRFDADRWFDPDRKARDKIYSRWGGFVDDLAFDPLKYGIPPTAIKAVEPAQLLALELVDQALRDAGLAVDNPHRDRTSVILGAGGGLSEQGAGYAGRSMLPGLLENPDESVWQQLPEWTEDSFPGILLNVIAGRISNRFDLGGVNYTVDAACASSLAAVYAGCRELADHTSDVVIAGGVDTVQNPFGFLCFAKSGALSPRGRCRAFDESADGIAISEGLAAVVLKRREDAERDGDRIYAVICAAAGGSDGRHKGLTAPRAEGQARTLARAYRQAGFSPASVQLFEAHGTGTALGDRTEAASLTQFLAEHEAAPQSHALGSVKSMIGHTKATAGVAGLIKAALALHHRVLPPTLNVETPNAAAGLQDGPLFVNAESRPWLRNGSPRRAGVSAFGFGGTNFHVVLEEYDDHARPDAPGTAARHRRCEVFTFSAAKPADLARQVRELAEPIRKALQAEAKVELADLANTWRLRRRASSGPCRGAVVGATLSDLLTKLDKLVAAAEGKVGAAGAGIHFAAAPLEGQVAFLFPGQGSQTPHMLRELATEFREVAESIETADHALEGAFEQALSRLIYPASAFTPESRKQQAAALRDTRVAQPALGACGLGMARLLAACGLRPAMLAGHSYGELAALCAAGAFDETTLSKLSLARGQAIVQALEQGGGGELGGMAAVTAPAARVAELLEGCPEVWLANFNSPRQTILSGSSRGLAEAEVRLASAGLTSAALPVGGAFHTPLMATAEQAFHASLTQAEIAEPRLPVYGNTKADVYPADGAAVVERLSKHLVGQVRFCDQIEAMYAAGARVFVEVGPGRVLSGLVAEILGEKPYATVITAGKDPEGLDTFLNSLAQLYCLGCDVDLGRLYRGRELREVNLRDLAAGALPAHFWLINGAYARPAREPRRVPTPQARLAGPAGNEPLATAAPSQPAASPTWEPPADVAPDTPAAPAWEAPAPMATNGYSVSNGYHSAPAAAETDLLAGFQQTMRQFLQTQEAVLSAYLGGGAATAPAALTNGHAAPVSAPAEPSYAVNGTNGHAPTPAPAPIAPVSAATVAPAPRPAAAPQPAASPAVAPAAARIDADALRGLLLDTVSERTGYPTEMLALDAALEADLGIDSIKRVEILGAFRRAAFPDSAEPPASFMEALNAAKTLQAILDATAAVTASSAPGPAAAAATGDAAPKNKRPDADMLRTLLLDTVSERTGYPTEMLALHAALEADLGIDSIKRVEILGAFRRAACPDVPEPPAWFMEALNGAKTLQGILDATARLGDDEPAQAAAATDELLELLFAAVKRRTGRDLNALSLDAPLDQLGFDVRQRVAIVEGVFTANQRPLVNGAREDLERAAHQAVTMRELRTLCERLGQHDGDAASQNVADDADCPYGVPRVVDAPLDAASRTLTAGPVLVTGDEALVAAVVQALIDAGCQPFVLSVDDLASREQTAAAVERVRRQAGAIQGVLHLLPLREAPDFPGIARADWQRHLDEEVRGTLFLLQAVAIDLADVKHRNFCFLTATQGGGDFQTADEASRPWRGGIAGLLKTAAKEWPQARFRAVDFDELPTAEELTREMAADGPAEIGYRGGQRLALEIDLVDVPPRVDATTSPWNGGIVLVTGGARGITARVAEEIARQKPCRFVLVGRSPAPAEQEPTWSETAADLPSMRRAAATHLQQTGRPVAPREVESLARGALADREVRQSLATLRSVGAEVNYLSCDVRDAEGFAALLADVRKRLGPIESVIHGAGIIEDRLIVDKTADSFGRVLGTKLDGLLTLVNELPPEELNALAVFSSVSAYFGNPGQADYAAANEILNRVCRRLRDQWSTRVVSFNWGPWAGSGMVTAEVAKQFADRGIGLVPVDGGCRLAWRELMHDDRRDVRLVCGPGDWMRQAQAPVELAASNLASPRRSDSLQTKG